MIFNSVTELIERKDKVFFKEKINIYIRHVEVFCELNGIKNKIDNYNPKIDELISIGVIKEDRDLDCLKQLLGEKTYSEFIKTVNFAVEYKLEIGNLLDKLSNKKRKEIQEVAAKKNKYTLIDFFCGAGGLSLGFLQQGFNVKLANDIDDVCIETYKYNHPELPSNKLIKGDIKDIVDNIEQLVDQDIDIVVGGPPCQGFSEANRQRIIDDPRNQLYKYFVKAVEKITPKFVVMENVKGMLKVANQVVEDFGQLRTKNGYSYFVSYRVLNSQNFSVAQSRERLIYIAIRSDIAESKDINPTMIFNKIENKCKHNKVYNLKDALLDIKKLDAPRIKNMNDVDSDLTGKKIDVNKYAKNNNMYLNLINQGRIIPFLYNHRARYVNDINYEIYKRLNSGDDATDEKIKDIMPYAHRNHCFKDKYYKLVEDKPCRTITAHMRMDCHSHIHPTQIRSLTPREAARIQSFPDDYLFLGAYLKTYMQIGNAVPPIMARGIAECIKNYL